MSETRERIAEAVGDRPGVHFNALVRALDLAPGQTQYHLRRLTDDGRVRREEHWGRTHYYPPDWDEWERRALALLRRETARDLLAELVADGPQRPEEAADRLDVARSTLEWHLDRLVAADLVRKRRDERNRVTLVLERPDETVQLLAAVDPSLPDRLVDRFSRLVDRLLEDAG